MTFFQNGPFLPWRKLLNVGANRQGQNIHLPCLYQILLESNANLVKNDQISIVQMIEGSDLIPLNRYFGVELWLCFKWFHQCRALCWAQGIFSNTVPLKGLTTFSRIHSRYIPLLRPRYFLTKLNLSIAQVKHRFKSNLDRSRVMDDFIERKDPFH